MSNNHLYARRKSDGDKVFIDDVPNGKKCGCICSKCHEPLIAKNGGEINIHHFAHISDSNCTGETEAHFEAKEIIKREKYLWLPNYDESKKVEFDDVQVEYLIKNYKYRADLLCTAKGKEIAVEIVVTHDLDAGCQLKVVNYLVNKGAGVNIKSGLVSTKDMAIKSLNDWETGRISGVRKEERIENLGKIIEFLTKHGS